MTAAMNWEEWGKHDAVALAELIRTKQVSVQEVVAQAASAVEHLNPRLGAVLEIYQSTLTDVDVDRPNRDGRL